MSDTSSSDDDDPTIAIGLGVILLGGCIWIGIDSLRSGERWGWLCFLPTLLPLLYLFGAGIDKFLDWRRRTEPQRQHNRQLRAQQRRLDEETRTAAARRRAEARRQQQQERQRLKQQRQQALARRQAAQECARARKQVEHSYLRDRTAIQDVLPVDLMRCRLQIAFPPDMTPAQAWQAARDFIAEFQDILRKKKAERAAEADRSQPRQEPPQPPPLRQPPINPDDI